MYFMLIYFYLLLSGNKFTVSLYLLIFVDPPRIVNHKGKQNSEKIQRVKIRPSFKANDISMTVSSNLLYFNFAKPCLA